ncbi:secretory lipase domain-containing protein [Hirsutella rhossiliensis]|uniref:Secretory lipase domain-containing protein n=1 Tax=Hirsutella rhossiliensis TaxID=111463 RepID=A0A9P8MKP2_9HYPO|nr:secretory lipase domain-containing protein [Hirsutella rhossiliensis]KAH0957092.1 secretory lipase domain-containing protein [Hirsutella rhossiliensis]
MRAQFALCALATGAGAASAAWQANVTADEAKEASCGDKCLEAVRRGSAEALMFIGTNFDSDFYATASNMTGSRPGDVLKLQPVNPDQRQGIKAGTSIWRFQYTTVDLDGTLVPATGFVAFPYGAPPAGGKFRLVAYAHGTIGIFPRCVPSTVPNLFDYDTWQPLVSRGYAVVATDYAGLGNNATQHKYCSFNAHAADVYYSVVAARRLFGHVLTRKWMAAGHSQGGGAAWKLAESGLVANDAAYLGTVALAPATYAVDMVLRGLDEGAEHSAFLPYLPLAVHRANASYHETLLSDTMRRRVRLAETAQLCNSAVLALTDDLKGQRDQLVSLPGIERDMDTLLRWQDAEAPGQGSRSPAPVLVLQGLNDTTVLAPITMRAVESSCGKGGNEVHLSLYPGLEHTPVVQAGAPEWLGWIDARFAAAAAAADKNGALPTGKGGKGGKGQKCSWRTREAFHMGHVSLPPGD